MTELHRFILACLGIVFGSPVFLIVIFILAERALPWETNG